ncbi:hypothetical protein QAD02_009525 [Eretmocerus hayati]|uniref:Uncharacterized protein n=1 Tax=Eretmocerus hayati TaxID=131215 RepID=A0ACC2N9M2_9HYME|nr:hypothetical protein QAD02_009525 [Eretmocerus hayati]
MKRVGLDLELERAEVNCDCEGISRDENRRRWRGSMREKVEMKERQDKKLRRMEQKVDNSAVRSESERPTVSYLQLYYRKFNAEGLRSPKGSLRSDCGEDRSSNSSDERRRDLVLDPELESFHNQNIDELQRDDRSEMNFYQRLLESAKRDAVQRKLEEQANLAANIIARHQNSAPQLKIGPVGQKQQVYRRRCCGERRNFESDRVGFRTSSAINEREDVVEAKVSGDYHIIQFFVNLLIG